jgi:hypothetical protein
LEEQKETSYSEKEQKKIQKNIEKADKIIKVLYEIVWVIELQFSAGKIDHVDKVGSISVSSGSFFC